MIRKKHRIFNFIKQQKYHGLMALVIIVLLTMPFVKSRKEAAIVLKVPDGYRVGQLVTLDASASKADEIIWKIIPNTLNFKVMEKIAVFSSPEPIDYTIMVIGRKDKNMDCLIFNLAPRKTKKIVCSLTDFEKSVKSWLSPKNHKTEALRLAQSFRIIARTIENGTYENVDDIILATAYANSDALGQDLEVWKPFLRRFQEYLENDPPVTIKDHAAVWYNIANALKKVFE